MTKPTKWHVRLAKTQISLGVRPVWSVFSVRMKKAWVLSYPLGHSKDADQTGWMPRLIWVFAGSTCHFVGFVMRRLISFVFCYIYFFIFDVKSAISKKASKLNGNIRVCNWALRIDFFRNTPESWNSQKCVQSTQMPPPLALCKQLAYFWPNSFSYQTSTNHYRQCLQ